MKVFWLLSALFLLGPVVPGRAGEEKKPNDKSVQVPYRLTDTLHVLVRAKINGKGPFNFILDTGAPVLFVATSVGKQLGVTPDKNGWATFDRFEIEGGVVIPKARGRVETPFQLEGMNGLGLAGAELHGMIGYNLLARYRLEFDFTRDKMTWTPVNFKPAMPLRMDGRGGTPGGLDTLGSVMKVMGWLMGKKPQPEVKYRGYLGVEVRDDEHGVVVEAVHEKSPAARVGVKPGDRISHFQGKAVRSSAELHRLAGALAAGQTAKLTIVRNRLSEQISVKLEEGL
jgi:membrane-associated protease RseP (regulator of RpoE activity)